MRPIPLFGILIITLTLALIGCSKTPTPVADDAERETLSMTFGELRKLGENYTCTFTDTDAAGNVSSGTVYVASEGENLRGDFSVVDTEGITYEGSLIRKGDTNYIWTTQQEEGIIMRLDPEDESLFGADAALGDEAGIGEEDPVAFECSEWQADSLMFEPPADREFIDLEAMMQGMMDGMMEQMQGPDGMKDAQCGACDEITDAAAKTQCKQALGC